MKKILFALVAAAALLVGCQPKPVLVSSIKLSETTLNMVEGDTQHISAIVSPKEATNPEVTWTSGNTSVATVTGSGDITAVAPGEAKITVAATDGSGVTATCQVNVTKKVIPVSKIELNETALRLKPTETFQLEAVVTPSDATYNHPKWVSSDVNVATVENGKVTAVAPGTANITAEAADESGVKSAACVVTVIEPKTMFAKFQDMVIRQGQKYTNQAVWYGTVDAYADREDVAESTWTSDNESIVAASVGNIEGIAPGKANVTIADPDGNKIVIPVEVLAATNKDYDYNYGIELLSNKALYDAETGFGLNGNGTLYLGDGYAQGTQCYHVKDLHREDPKTGNPKIVYLISQAKFAPVDISAIEHPALYLRLYVSNVDLLHMDGANSQIELSSNGADNSEELTWTGGRVFTNWEGQYGEPKFQLKNGWNNIVLPLEYAEGGSEFRPKMVNWFRMYHNPAATYDMTGKDIEFAIDQLRIVDWTEFDTCDNFDQWFDGGTGNNRPCFRAKENFDGHEKVFGSVDELITGPISNFRIKEWAGRVYSLPVNMDSQNAKFSWWFWVDDAAWFNKCHIKAELSSENVNDAHNWAWGKNPGELNLQNGWNQITYDFSAAEDQSGASSLRSDRKINYFRIVVTPMEGATSSVHTYYIDDLRVSKK